MENQTKLNVTDAETTDKAIKTIQAIDMHVSKASLSPLDKRYTKQQIENIISENYGIATVCCAILDCTYKQFYNIVKKHNLEDHLKQSKKQLVGLAEKAIVDCLNSENELIKLKSAEITLKSLGKDEWSQQPQVQIAQQINVTDKENAIKSIFGIE